MSTNQKARSANCYRIEVAGGLDRERAEWFGDMAMTVTRTDQGTSVTVLTGPVADRAALFGILNRIRDLGLWLISVSPTESEGQGSALTISEEE